MGRKDRWASSQDGPDWTDVAMTLREVERLHEAWVSVRLLSDGSRASSSLRIVCSAFGNQLISNAESGVCMVQGEYPNPRGTTITGEIYRLLLMLDHELLEKNWIQREMFD